MPSCVGSWWIQKMSCETSSQTQCHQRFVNGWLPLSPDREAGLYAAVRTSIAFGALSMQYKLASLLRGLVYVLYILVYFFRFRSLPCTTSNSEEL